MDEGKQAKLLLNLVHWYLHADLPTHTDRDASTATSTVLGERDSVSNMLPVDGDLVIPVPLTGKKKFSFEMAPATRNQRPFLHCIVYNT